MSEYTYKDVIIDPEDPRVEIGKEYYFGECPIQALNFANDNGRGAVLSMVDDADNLGPFWFRDIGYSHAKGSPCIIRKKEPEKKYVPFDLSDPEQIGMLYFCWLINKDSGDYHSVTAIYPNDNLIHIDDYGDINPQDLLERFKFMYEDMPCGKLVEE